MTAPNVLIVGAGIGGTCLGALLRRKEISYQLIDKLKSAPDYSYTISLQPRAYRPLLRALGLDDNALKQQAVSADADGSLRLTRSAFENLVRSCGPAHVDWSRSLESISQHQPGLASVTLDNGATVTPALVVAGDGVHSKVRDALLPDARPVVLPFVVFNGKRRIVRSAADKVFGDLNGQASHLAGDTRLAFGLVDSQSDTDKPEVSLSYTVSRPLRPGQDNLGRLLDRSVAGATDIPQEFFDEIAGLHGLPQPFNTVFDPALVRSDRLLHWLMRKVTISTEALLSCFKSFGVIFMGDAVHATPILGGDGANEAILDALALAEMVQPELMLDGDEYYKKRHGQWQQTVASSQQVLLEMHLKGHGPTL